MKIVITGINGFAGKILRDNLIKHGAEVYGIDLQGGLENVFSADIADLESINNIFKKIAPDFIFHLAAVSRVDSKTPLNIFKINVDGTLNVLIAAAAQDKMPRFLYVSSSQVYGNADISLQPIRENFPVSPVNLYGASKAAAENIVRAFRMEFGLPSVIVRPFNHTGRGQQDHFIIPKLVSAFKGRKKEISIGDINVRRDYLDVRDVVDAYVIIMDNFTDGETFNISSGRSILISDIIQKLKALTGHEPALIPEKGLLRKNEISYSEGDSSRIRRMLNWKPRYSLEDTLSWMLED